MEAALLDADSTIDIAIGAGFAVDRLFTIPAGKTVTINGGGHTLTRGAAYVGVIFSETGAGSSLTLKDFVLDGNKIAGPTDNPAILVNNATASLDITGASIIKNFDNHLISPHASISGGTIGGVINGYSCASLVIEGSTKIIGNVVERGVLFAFSDTLATIRGDVEISGNKSTGTTSDGSRGGIIVGYGNPTVTVEGNVKIHDNESTDAGGAFAFNHAIGTATLTITGNVEIYRNKSIARSAGAIFINQGKKLTILGNVKIYENESANYAGAILNNGAEFIITGGAGTDKVEIYNNKAAVSGGAIYNYPGKLTISGNVEIYGNKAGTSSGAIHNSGGELAISGNVKIYDNEAATYCGAVYSSGSSKLRISGYVEIYGNESNGRIASTLLGCGGVYIGAADAAISGDVKIYNNKTNSLDGGGGGIAVAATATNPLQITGNVQIYDNETNGNGGGIFNLAQVEIDDAVSITGNEAAGNGGGIYTSDYAKLQVGKDVTFADNKARASYEIKASDIALHDANILTKTFTSPFKYGYNNYDINYYRSDAKTSSAAGTAGTGDIITYTVTVKNSSTAAGDIIIKDKAPAGTGGFADTTQAAGNLTVTAEGDLTVWTFANVAAGADAVVTFTVKVIAETGEISNTALVKEPADTTGFRDTPTTADKLANPYAISYKANTGTGTMADTAVVYGENAALRANAFAKAGCTFTGWNTAANGTGATYANGHAFTPYSIAGNLTLHAQWKAIDCTVTYAPGAHGIFAAQVTGGLHYGDATPAAPQTPSEAGWRFTGWTPSPAAAVSGTATYTAQWELSSYTIYYDGNGNTAGAPPSAETHGYGSNAAIQGKGGLEKAGFAFLGWSRDASAAAADCPAGGALFVDGEITLYAVWAGIPATPAPVTPEPPAPKPPVPPRVIPPALPETPEPEAPVPAPAPEPEPAAGPAEEAPPQDAAEAGAAPAAEAGMSAAYAGLTLADEAKLAVQTGNIFSDLAAGNVPLGNGKSSAIWSLLSLILSVVAVVITALLAAGALLRRRNKDGESEEGAGGRGGEEKGKRRGRLLRLLSGIVGILTPIVWLILDDTRLPMAWINRYTFIVAIFFIAHLALLAVYKARRGKAGADEEEGEGESRAGRKTA